MNPEKLTQLLKIATGPLLSFGAFAGAIAAGIKFLQPLLVDFLNPFWALIVALAVPSGAALVLLWASFRIVARKSRLLRPECFDFRVRRREDLLGRDNDIDDLRSLLQDFNLVFLDGESGSGKSSLIAYGFVPVLRASSRALPLLISEYSGDWDVGLARQAYDAIWSALDEVARSHLGIAEREPIGTVTVEIVGHILRELATKLGRETILIFDQFDDYQLAHRARFLDEHHAWISSDALTAKNRFWCVIADTLAAGHVKLVFVVRSDVSAGLHSIRLTQPNAARSVLRLGVTWLPRLLNQISSDDGKGVIISDPESGWVDLKRLLEHDLNRGGSVLPQQIRITLLGLRMLPALTPTNYRHVGRAAGAEALYIREAIRTASETSGLTETQVRALLLALVERGPENSLKTCKRTDRDLSKLISDDAARRKALSRLKLDEIVRQSDNGNEEDLRWQLDHDYLAQAVVAEERVANRYAVILRDGAEAWDRAGDDWWARYKSLLPLRTQLTLGWAKLRSRDAFSYGRYSGFAFFSLLRAAPLIIIAVGAGGWLLWTNSESYQIGRLITLAAQVKTSLGDDGAPSWADALALSGRSDEALAQAHAANAADAKAKMLAQIAARTAERGEPERAVSILQEAVTVGKNSPENARMDVYLSIVIAATELIRIGASDKALNILGRVRSEALSIIPRGNNRAFVALQMARLYRILGRTDLADTLLLDMKPDISVDQYNLPSAAIELHRAGDNQNALALIGEYLPLVQSQSSDHRRDSDVLARAKLADAYRILGKTSESAEMLQSAIDEAMSIPAMQTENVSEARSYLEYFEFQNASQFAKVLIRGKRSEVVSQIALREGDVHVRVDVFVTAAKESFRAGLAEDADRFMHRAAEQAYAALQPFQRSQALMAVAYGYGAVSKISESKATLLEALSAANNIQEAYLSVERLDGAEQKLDSMIGIAAALLDMESLTEGKAVLNEAQALSRRTTKDPSYYLPRFARELALSGQLKMAANVAERVRDGDEQLSAFANVLSGYTLYKEPALRKKLNANKMANAVDDE